MGKIWIAGHPFEVDAKVVRWDEGPGYDAHKLHCVNTPKCPDGVTPFGEKAKNRSKHRFSLRPALRSFRDQMPPLEAAQAVIRQFVIHHDGCADAAMCFHVLQNERGLSCHFLLDNDGTFYQTLDLAYMGFHAGGFNANSIGVEISSRGDAKKWPDYYIKRRQKRDTTTVRIHGHVYKCFRFTPEQEDAMRAMAKGLARALPNLPLEYPQDTPGHQSWTVIPNAATFAGYMGHYHTTRNKWDPGAFDFKDFCEKARGSLCFPVFVAKNKKGPRPEVPETEDKLRSITEELYELNESKSEGGYFPVGPDTGDHGMRLWHGGVHLSGQAGDPVFAPFPGRLLAARMGLPTSIGSVNFVLLRHDMTIGTASIRFYSLFFHLQDELDTKPADKGAPEWLASEAWQKNKASRRTVLLSEPIEAGRIIGRIGVAGPEGYQRPQLHFEIFATEEITEQIESDKSLLQERWEIIDGTAGGRFSTAPQINDLIDVKPKDGRISRAELLDFFRQSGDRQLTRNIATLHTSEWTNYPDWVESLKIAPEYAKLGKPTLESLVAEQIMPTLWWTDEVAKHAKLPKDGVVFHYHPISFVKYFNSKLLQAGVATGGIGSFAESEAKETPEGVTDDFDDVSGESFVDDSELLGEVIDTDMPLEELIKGFPE